jgi:hypothetical protein
MRVLPCVFLVLLGFAGGARAQDFQQWNELDLAGSVRGYTLTAPLVARTDAAQSVNPILAATGLLLDTPMKHHVSGTVGYLWVTLPGSDAQANVPLLAATAQVRVRHLRIDDRNRFEQLVSYSNSPVRYRQRLLLEYPLGRRGRVQALCSDEPIWVLTPGKTQGWNQNRLQLGVEVRVAPRVTLDNYYLQRNAPSGATVYAIGTQVRVRVFGR